MKLGLLICSLTILAGACALIEYKENRAIEICQKAKMQFDNMMANVMVSQKIGTDATWLDYANMMANSETSSKYSWTARSTGDENIYEVEYVNEDNWGYRWEVDIEQQIVKFINQNEYLCRKYGLSRLDANKGFQISKIYLDTLKLESSSSYEGYTKKIVFLLKANVTNKTGKLLTDANASGSLSLIFKDKTVAGESGWESGLKSAPSKSKPWSPDTERQVSIKTQGIDPIYLSYDPEYIFFEVNVKAEDPVGFTYNKVIEEFDLMKKWKALKSSKKSLKKASDASDSKKTKGSKILQMDRKKVETKDEETEESIDAKSIYDPHEDVETEKSGDKGSAEGTLDAKELYGTPRSGGIGMDLQMAGWAWADQPIIPDLLDNENGKVIFEIECDNSGEIIALSTLERSVSPKSEQIIKNEIRKNSLVRSSGGRVPERSKGRIVVILKTK